MPELKIGPETAKEMAELLMDGETTVTLGKLYDVANTTVRDAVLRIGFVYEGPAGHGKWIRKQEHTTMNGQTSGEWNMSTDDYKALLLPEREQETNAGAPHQDQVDYETDEAERAPERSVMAQLTNDDDLQAAARLLDQAAEVRRIDVALITELQARVDDLMLRLGAAALSAQNEYDKYDRQIVQLETENKRLNDQIKVEISRGFLRKSMDNLRSVLE